jgi:hypothetical protein
MNSTQPDKPIDAKLARAFAYLRDNRAASIYCMDIPVPRLPAQSRQPTLLDRWLSKRPS